MTKVICPIDRRPPEIVHAGRKFWRVRKDGSQILREFWYTEGAARVEPHASEFDVRCLPTYDRDIQQRRMAGKITPADLQSYHASVVAAAVDAGADMVAISNATTLEERLGRLPSVVPEDLDAAIPF